LRGWPKNLFGFAMSEVRFTGIFSHDLVSPESIVFGHAGTS
jgi:hypothetical protein